MSSSALPSYDWIAIESELDLRGCAVLPKLLNADQCADMAAQYDRDAPFRSRVVMARHGFGQGEYRYFAYPLPDLVQRLRAALYPHLAPIANRWHARMGMAARFPDA